MNQICQLNKARRNFDVNERSAAFHSDRISEDIFFCWNFINKEMENSMGLPKSTNARVYQAYMEAVQNCPRFQVFNLCKTGDTK